MRRCRHALPCLLAVIAALSLTRCSKKECRPGYVLVSEGGVEVCRDPAYEAARTAAAKAEAGRPAPSLTPPRPPLPPPEVAATKLWQDYEENEVAADQRYQEKRLLVIGVVESVQKDLSGKPYLYLESGNIVRRIPMRFRNDETERLATLKKGNTFRASCTCMGRKIGSPDLVDCSPQ